MQELIEKYTQLIGVSGAEKNVKQELLRVYNEVRKTSNKELEVYEDKLGSVGFLIKNPDAKRTLGFFGHQDEVGLMVKGIDEDGKVSVINIGGLTVESLISQRVRYIDESGQEHIGVVLAPSPHVKEKKTERIEDLKLSFGFESRDDAAKIGMELGSYLYFIGDFVSISNNQYLTKAADNRIGIAFVENLLRIYTERDSNCNIFIGASVQEELGLRGIGPLLGALDFNIDEIYVMDVSPIDNMEDYGISKGALIRRTEPRTVYSIVLNEKLNKLAKSNGIGVQNYFAVGGTDARAAQIHGAGNVITALCVPALNLHTNSTLFSMNDVDEMQKLLEKVIEDE